LTQTLDINDREAIRAALAQRNAADMKFGQGGYRDTGCDMAPSCLSCPFVTCRHDISPEKMKENHRMQQLFLIRRMTEDGKTQDQIAAALDVGKRRVQRILASGRKNP
tara:strand:- start:43 stop:366 length:324 start_codon:yes stop_codon:yes gene_type:complete